MDLFTGLFYFGLLKKVMYLKTPYQHGRIPRKPSNVQCQPYQQQIVWCLSQQVRKKECVTVKGDANVNCECLVVAAELKL